MAPRFETADEEHIEELNDKSENENTNSTEYWKNLFQKVGEWKKLPRKFRGVRERCPQINTVAVLYLQKFSNFALYVSNK